MKTGLCPLELNVRAGTMDAEQEGSLAGAQSTRKRPSLCRRRAVLRRQPVIYENSARVIGEIIAQNHRLFPMVLTELNF